MNTPPPPLLPLTEDTMNGLYHYFGQPNTQLPQLTNNLRNVISNDDSSMSSIFSGSNTHVNNTSNATNATARQTGVLGNFIMNPAEDFNNNGRETSIQEKKLSLNRKLAQRVPKQELVERGILPPPRVPMQHYDNMKHLELAQRKDILETKLEKRPNRDSLVQINILPESNVAPSIQSKYNQLKRARLVDHLNEILAKRPGPLELVESGILVSADAKLTEAIKDGKINYPRTSGAVLNRMPYHQQSATAFQAFDETSLSHFNFNFNCLTDNEDSNTSSTATASSSSLSSFNFNLNNLPNQNQQTPDFNFGDIFQSNGPLSNAPSPSSSISTTIAKYSPVSSPFSNLDYLNNDQIINAHADIKTVAAPAISSKGLSKKQSKSSFSSASSVSSASSQKSSNKKFLYFIEYKGPHQKTLKSSISLKPANVLRANKSKLKSTNQKINNMKSKAFISNSTNLLNGTSEQFYEDSNDSTQLNSQFGDDELNAYEIRLEQQKVFLEYSMASKEAENPNQQQHKQQNSPSQVFLSDSHSQPTEMQDVDTILTSNNNDMTNSVQQTEFNQQFDSNFDKELLDAFYSSNENSSNNISNSTSNNITNTPQSMQLVPIGDLQLLENWRNIGLVPLQTYIDNANNQKSQTQMAITSSNPAANTCMQNGANLAGGSNIYSIDSETGTLKPLLLSQEAVNCQSQNSNHDNKNLVENDEKPLKDEDNSKATSTPTSNPTPLPSTTTTTTTTTNTTATKQRSQKSQPLTLEEMSLNELREECVRRSLPKSGRPKQKLIERIKDHMIKSNNYRIGISSTDSSSINGITTTTTTTTTNTASATAVTVSHIIDAQYHRQLSSAIKSPDSGVNMDGPASFSMSTTSCEQSPCSSVNSLNLPTACNNTNGKKGILNNLAQKPKTVSSLDHFFESLNVEELGSSKACSAEINDNLNNSASEQQNKIDLISTQLKLDTFKSKEALALAHNNYNNNCNSNEANNEESKQLTETAANLEMSLKNSAELLKQISSIGQMEHLQQLEQQMQQSMQLIEKLKSASNQTLAPEPEKKLTPQEYLALNGHHHHHNHHHNLNNLNTMSVEKTAESKLRLINSMPEIQQQQQQQHHHHHHHQQQQQVFYIPHSNSEQLLLYNEISNICGNKSQKGDDSVYKFDNLKKELTSTHQQIRFSNCDNDDNNNDEENSTLILIQQNNNNNNKNFNSNFNQHMPLISAPSSVPPPPPPPPSTQAVEQKNTEMEWNDSDIFQLCQELDEHDAFFNSTNQNRNLDFDLDGSQQHQQHQQHQQQFVYNQISFFNNELQQQGPLNNNNNINSNFLDNNNSDSASNVLIQPWEFVENDISQITSYLQSPTI
jgi:hypothetical protein